uniref:Uncharacterized protein n=1 Tax=Knipowitschia caucasica TaxID=637954 RepID=A0AAV2LE52_KNICA
MQRQQGAGAGAGDLNKAKESCPEQPREIRCEAGREKGGRVKGCKVVPWWSAAGLLMRRDDMCRSRAAMLTPPRLCVCGFSHAAERSERRTGRTHPSLSKGGDPRDMGGGGHMCTEVDTLK